MNINNLWAEVNQRRATRDFWRGVRDWACVCAAVAFAVWLVFAIIQGVGVWL